MCYGGGWCEPFFWVCFFHFVCRERKQSEVCVRELAYKRRERDREVGEASTAKAADGRRERDVRRGVVWWVGPRGRAVRGHRLASAEPRRLVSVCATAAAHTRTDAMFRAGRVRDFSTLVLSRLDRHTCEIFWAEKYIRSLCYVNTRQVP